MVPLREFPTTNIGITELLESSVGLVGRTLGMARKPSVLGKAARIIRRARARIGLTPAGYDPLPEAPDMSGRRFLFIAGLHRSGTSILHRVLREHPQTSGIDESSAPQDEGQHLQTVYRPANEHGGPGRFALDASARLTENSRLATDDNRQLLLREWGRWYDLSKSVLLEKSPPNIVRARFLQALFPDARFVFLVRHPVPVMIATRRWTGLASEPLFRHWAHAHRIMLEDVGHLDHALVLRYEDLVSDSDAVMARILALCDLERFVPAESLSDHNRRYFEHWEGDVTRKTGFDQAFSEIATSFGYGFNAPYVRPWDGLSVAGKAAC